MASPPTLDTIPMFQLRTGPSFQYREPKLVPSAPALTTNYTEFYMQSTGANINAGSTTDANAIYTSTNGNWSTTTNQYIPTDNSNPVANGVQAGMYASIYIDAATTAVYIAQITSVTNAINGAINFSSTAIYGTAPVTSATGRSIKVGGSWLGPSGASAFPFGLLGNISALSTSHRTRLNVKNDQTYTTTSLLTFNSMGQTTMQGYSSTPGDGGKATFTSNVTNNNNFGTTSNRSEFIDLIFINTGGSNNNSLMAATANSILFVRCVFQGARGSGILQSSNGILWCSECEFYNCNVGNTANGAAISASNSSIILVYNCYFHDCTNGINNHGVACSSGAVINLQNCIFDTFSGNGINYADASNGLGHVVITNCTYYNIAGDAIKYANTLVSGPCYLYNNLFVNIGGRVINNTLATQTGTFYNNARLNIGSSDVLGSFVNLGTDIQLPYNSTIFNSPTTGNFSLVLSMLRGVGRANFVETLNSKSGTLSYPDIGASQSQPATQGFAQSVGKQILPYGYINHTYLWQWGFSSPTNVSVVSGSLPPGLVLVQATTQLILIQGTPTTVGTYDFTLRATVGTSTGDSAFEITVFNDPDEGLGGIICG